MTEKLEIVAVKSEPNVPHKEIFLTVKPVKPNEQFEFEFKFDEKYINNKDEMTKEFIDLVIKYSRVHQ